MQTRLIVGCGYVGRRVANVWKARGDRVLAVTRSSERAEKFAADGLEPVVADLFESGTLGSVPAIDSVLFAVGFDRSTGQSMIDIQRHTMTHLLEQIPNSAAVAMVSSTGVYGPSSDADAWVDETAECQPNREGGRACLAAEHVLENSAQDRWIILRSAGIYGPERARLGSDLERKDPWPVAAHHWLNLVHVADLVDVIVWSLDDGETRGRFNVSDGSPVQRRDYYRYLVQLHGLPEPEFCDPSDDPARPDRSRGSKRISNRKLRERLPHPFKFPNYQAGLASIVTDASPTAGHTTAN